MSSDDEASPVDGDVRLPDCICDESKPERALRFNNCTKRCMSFPNGNGDGTTPEDDAEFNRRSWWNFHAT